MTTGPAAMPRLCERRYATIITARCPIRARTKAQLHQFGPCRERSADSHADECGAESGTPRLTDGPVIRHVTADRVPPRGHT